MLRVGLRLHTLTEQTVSDELAEPDTPAVIGNHVAVLQLEPFSGGRELGCCTRQEECTNLRRGFADRGAALVHRVTAGGIAFVRRALSVGRYERDLQWIDAQL